LAYYDKESGLNVTVGSTVRITHLTFSDSGDVLWGSHKDRLYQIDVNSGAATLLGNMTGYSSGTELKRGDLFFVDDVLYLLTQKSIYRINLETLLLTKQQDHGLFKPTGAAISQSGHILISHNKSYQLTESGRRIKPLQFNTEIVTLETPTSPANYLKLIPNNIHDLTSFNCPQPPKIKNVSVEITTTSIDIDLADTVTSEIGQVIDWSTLSFNQPEHGTVELSDTKKLTVNYPEKTYAGIDRVTVSIRDNHGQISNLASITLVADIYFNTSPQAQDSTKYIAQNITPTSINLKEYVSDDGLIDWGSLNYSQPQHGQATVSVGQPGQLTLDYSGENYTGSDKITFSVSDMQGKASNLATITLNVDVKTNNRPIAQNVNVSIGMQSTIQQVDLSNYIQDDGKIAWNTLTFGVLDYGTIRLAPNRPTVLVIDYSQVDYVGSESVQFSVQDTQGLQSAPATIHLSVNVDNNHPPLTSALTRSINNENRVLIIDLAAYISDDDNAIDWSSLILSQPVHGLVTANSNGIITLDFSDANHAGNDKLTYRVSDMKGAQSELAQISLTINVLKNRAPLAKDTQIVIAENTLIQTLDLAQFVSDDYGVDWSTLTVGSPTYGKLVPNPGASKVTLDYSGVSYSGSEQLSYSVKDIAGVVSNSAIINIVVDITSMPKQPEQINVALIKDATQHLGIVNVNWAQLDSLEYNILSQLNDGEWSDVALGIVGDQTKVHKLVNGRYRFKVQACHKHIDVCSPYNISDEIVVLLKPAKVSQISSPSLNNSGTLTLSWDETVNATFYKVEQNSASQEDWTNINSNITSASLIIGVASNDQYKYRVYACNNAGCSQSIESVYATVDLSPNAPGVLHALAGEQNTSLAWTPVSDASHYKISLMLADDSWRLLAQTGAENSYTAGSVSKIDNQFSVTACNSYGCSEPTTAIATDAGEVSKIIVNYFYSSSQVLAQSGMPIQFNWQVEGAISINITDQHGQSFENLAPQGTLIAHPQQSTDYTIKAVDGAGDEQSQTIRLIVEHQHGNNEPWLTTRDNQYVTPIASSMLIDDDGNRYFGDLQGYLHKISSVDEATWEPIYIGQISSPPILYQQFLYFTASASDGSGKFCRVESNLNNLKCQSVANAVIGAPAINFATQTAWIIDQHATLTKIDLSDWTKTTSQPLPQGITIRSTPILTKSGTMAIRSTDNQLFLLDLAAVQSTINWKMDLKGANDE